MTREELRERALEYFKARERTLEAIVDFAWPLEAHMVKPDEMLFIRRMVEEGGGPYNQAGGKSPREIGEELGMHYKRVIAICLKWAGRGDYDYGVASDMGWLTPKGWEKFSEQSHERD